MHKIIMIMARSLGTGDSMLDSICVLSISSIKKPMGTSSRFKTSIYLLQRNKKNKAIAGYVNDLNNSLMKNTFSMQISTQIGYNKKSEQQTFASVNCYEI